MTEPPYMTSTGQQIQREREMLILARRTELNLRAILGMQVIITFVLLLIFLVIP